MSRERKYAIGDYVMLWGRTPARIVEFYDEECEPTSEHWYQIEFAEIDAYRGTTFAGQPESALRAGVKEDFNKERNASVDKAALWLADRIEKLRCLHIG